MLDTKKLIAEIAERHHMSVLADDPIFVTITAHERVLEDTVAEMLKAVEATMTRLDASLERAENRAGKVLAECVKDSSGAVRRALHEDIGAASLQAAELVRAVHRAHSQQSLRFWTGATLICTLVLCAASFWLGRVTALP